MKRIRESIERISYFLRDPSKQAIPRPIKGSMRRIFHFSLDLFDLLLRLQDEVTPKRVKRAFVGQNDFKKTGNMFFQYFIELGELKPSERVLDVGCGIGRMALPLTKYLDERGSYEGFDIVAHGINWCRKKITPKYPNFRFRLADVFNKVYNPKGKYKASEYNFPYENESFDFLFLTSVFTHMRPQDMKNYFFEISRVLRRDGRCLITFFLLNKESLQLINAEKCKLVNFEYKFSKGMIMDRNVPERAIAYNERFIRTLYEKHRLNIVEPIRYGSWCGRTNFLAYQDIILAKK